MPNVLAGAPARPSRRGRRTALLQPR